MEIHTFLGYTSFSVLNSLMLNDGSLLMWVFGLTMQSFRISDLQKVDPIKACDYFNSCFKDPSTFTVVIVGNIDPTIAIPLILQYLVR